MCGSDRGRFRVVALVRDGDHLVAEPEGEQQLGSVRHKADDPHRRQAWHPVTAWRQRARARLRVIEFEAFEPAIASAGVV